MMSQRYLQEYWSTKADGDGALVLDGLGNVIGRFNDWKTAERVVEDHRLLVNNRGCLPHDASADI